jgi:hypothetical protein
MAASTTKSWWQYARWTWNIARNSRITEPTGDELAAFKAFIKTFWNPMASTGTRPWLATDFQKKAVTAGSNYQCNIDTQPTHVLVELVNMIGHDLKKIPLTDAEAARVETLIAATDNRRIGSGPKFGGVIGSEVGVAGQLRPPT